MLIRRHTTARVAVIEGEIVDDPHLSPAALGLFCYLAAAPAGREPAEILARFGIDDPTLSALVDELREAGHLADDGPEDGGVQPIPPDRRRRAQRTPGLPPSASALLRAIRNEADAEGRARPLNRHLAEATGLAAGTVTRNLALLEGRGLLRREMVDRGADGLGRLIHVGGRLPAGVVLQ